jgi:hypothetical protein
MYDTLQNLPGLGETIRLTDFDGTALDQMDKMLGGVRHFRMEDIDRAIYPATLYNEGWITAVLLENNITGGATNVLPKRIYTLDTGGTATFDVMQKVSGIGTTPNTTRLAVFADPFLPAAGCAYGYAFWGIVRGPTIAMSPYDYTKGVALAIGDRVTVSNEAYGRISGFGAPGSDQNAFDYANSVLGYAIEAMAVDGNSDESLDKWVYANVPWFGG